MLNWFEYYSACEQIRVLIRNEFKYNDNVTESETKLLNSIREFLPPEDYGDY